MGEGRHVLQLMLTPLQNQPTMRRKSCGKQVLSVLVGIVCLERAMLEQGSMHWCDAELRKETLGNVPQSPQHIHSTRGNLIFPPRGQGNLGAPLKC